MYYKLLGIKTGWGGSYGKEKTPYLLMSHHGAREKAVNPSLYG